MRHTHRIRCFLRCECGSALVELALLVPVFMFLIYAVVDFGRAFYMAQELASAAHAGAEYGAQNPTDTAGMQAAAQTAAPDVTGGATSAAIATSMNAGTVRSTGADFAGCSTRFFRAP